MITPLAFVVVILAAYRMTRAVVIDDITQPLRDYLTPKMGTRWGELVECPHCAGFWISILVVVVWVTAPSLAHPDSCPDLWRWFVVCWAVAGGQSLLASVAGRLDG